MIARFVGLALCAACKPSGESAPPTQETPASAAPSASASGSPSTAATSSASAAPAAAACLPEIDSWQPYRELDHRCDFALPSSRGALPPPIEWEPCSDELAPLRGCRQMRVRGFQGFDVNDRAAVGKARDGRPQLLFQRACHEPRRRMLVAAEADGAVLGAIASRANRNTAGCDAAPVFIDSGRYIYQLEGDPDDGSSNPASPEALDLGGSTQELTPTILHRLARGRYHQHIAGSSRQWGTIDGGVWMAPMGKDTESVHSGAVLSNLAVFGDTALFVDKQSSSLMAWTKERGTFPLHQLEDKSERITGIRFDSDVVVWSAFAAGALRGGECTLVAAKMSLEPPRITPKRVAKFSCPHDKERPWALGSGYAAHETSDPGIVIVRLSDGASWTVRSACKVQPDGATTGSCVGAPLFVSESELFFEIARQGFAGIARMPLSEIR